MHRVRVLGTREGEELDLRELVHAVEALALAAVRAGLGAEAVREAGVLHRQRLLVEDLVREEPAERDLGRADQAQVGVRDRVDLRLRRRAG